VLVLDASALATALTDDGTEGELARSRLRGEVLAAPELIDLEVASVLWRLVLSGQLPVRRGEQALADLMAVPVQHAPHLPLLARCWSLRDNLSVYDASYVTLAESLGSVLLTADARLSRAPVLRCAVEVLQASNPST